MRIFLFTSFSKWFFRIFPFTVELRHLTLSFSLSDSLLNLPSWHSVELGQKKLNLSDPILSETDSNSDSLDQQVRIITHFNTYTHTHAYRYRYTLSREWSKFIHRVISYRIVSYHIVPYRIRSRLVALSLSLSPSLTIDVIYRLSSRITTSTDPIRYDPIRVQLYLTLLKYYYLNTG